MIPQFNSTLIPNEFSHDPSLIRCNIVNFAHPRRYEFMSISVQQVSKVYGAQHALNEVSFELKPGEIVGFLGPNGAGKSTMMKIICCYLPPTSGSVQVCDHSIDTDELEIKKLVGYLPEHNPLYLDMYVKEYLEFAGGVHRLKNIRHRVDEMIDMVGLSVEQKKKVGALSKGYRQRLGLAQAMIHDPKVLILDEPTTGLDPNQLAEIRNLIRNIGREKTVMLSTHIMQEVDAICNRAIIINKGEIVADRPMKDLRDLSDGGTVVQVEFEDAIDEDKLKQLPGVKSVEGVGEHRWRIVASADKDIRNALFQLAVDEKSSVLTLNKEARSLEDVFKDLTRS